MTETNPVSAPTRSETTQARILDAAWDLIRERGRVPEVRIADIADAAGVSRQLVYHHFDSRAGLFEAMTRRYDEVSGFEERVRELVCLAPARALEAAIREWLNHVPAIAPVAAALEAARVNGDAGAVEFPRRMDELRDLFRFLAGRPRRRMDRGSGRRLDLGPDPPDRVATHRARMRLAAGRARRAHGVLSHDGDRPRLER